MPLIRRRGVPADVAALLDGAAGERLLAWSVSVSDAPVVATDRALHLPAVAGTTRIGWERVDKAVWNRDESELTVVEAVPGGRPRRHVVRLEEPGDLAIVVKQRVDAAVVISRRVPLDGHRGVTVVGRRPPGSDALSWTVSVERGVDLADPATRARVDAAVAEVRGEIGG